MKFKYNIWRSHKMKSNFETKNFEDKMEEFREK